MTPSGAQMAVDAGQSSTRVRLRDADGVREFSRPGVRNDRSTIAQVAAMVADFADLHPVGVAVGLSGFDHEMDAADILLAALPSARRAAVAHDSITGYLGANGTAPGVVAAVGTGIVILGVGPAGVARVDGAGALFGDAGSAYWIGRSGIEAVLRAHDGRGASTALTAAASTMFGGVDGIPLRLQADESRTARIAAFAREVMVCAEDGDDAARTIVDAAAAEIAHSIATAVSRAGLDVGTARISGVGGVMASPLLRQSLSRRVALTPPIGLPIDGVELLHTDVGQPLTASVITGRR